jgi:coenzyme PQQ precursor peptide PqqA
MGYYTETDQERLRACEYPGRGAGLMHFHPVTATRSGLMKWETPCAIDLRFGMEITMYIANR